MEANRLTVRSTGPRKKKKDGVNRGEGWVPSPKKLDKLIQHRGGAKEEVNYWKVRCQGMTGKSLQDKLLRRTFFTLRR